MQPNYLESKKRNNTPLIIIFSVLLILSFTTKFILIKDTVDVVIFYLIIPFAIAQYIIGKQPISVGFTWGRWKIGLFFSIIGSIITILIVYFFSRFSRSVYDYYSNTNLSIVLIIETIVYMFCWEFFLRGFLLFGLFEDFGFIKANLVQTLIFFITHWGKPNIEFYSTLLTGFIFGYIALKSRSFWPIIVIHIVIYISIVYFTKF